MILPPPRRRPMPVVRIPSDAPVPTNVGEPKALHIDSPEVTIDPAAGQTARPPRAA